MFDPTQAAIREATPVVDRIFELEDEMKSASLEELRQRVDRMREDVKPVLDEVPEDAKTALNLDTKTKHAAAEQKVIDKLNEFIPEFYAIMRELNRRKFGKPHYRVQLIASTILAGGNKLGELKTGEGKTQVFHLPAALYGLTGRGSHVITVNDYLARRDGEYAGHAMADIGISVGIITPQASYRFVPDDQLEETKGAEAAAERKDLNVAELADMKGTNLIECTKKEAYSCDVVYGTNNEFGFDYLRDNMAYNLKNRVQPELYFVIVDEADSILIDEARTPLIISAPAEQSNELYERFASMVKKLTRDKHFEVDEKSRSVSLTEAGVEYAEKLLGVDNLWEDYKYAHHLDNALKAEVLYRNDDEYIIKEGEVLIVDEFTGRVLPGRRYSEGLHQAIEAKEGVEIKRASRTMATITFQNFFKLYKVLAGGSGTIITEAEEFGKIFNLESYAIPTNKPVIRDDKNDKIYKDRTAKFAAVVTEIKLINETGRPILVGTASIEDSEFLSGLLDKAGVKHEVLNAKFHEREAQIVAKAGRKGAVTVATNMAGRGTDIPLGPGVEELGGLYIIGTQRHEARRIDNQLRGRGGRQGQPGTTQFFVGLDDEIMRIQGGELISRVMDMTNLPTDVPIQNPLISRSIESAQKKMEGANFDIRKRLVDYDNVMNQQREIFYTRRYNILRRAERAANAEDESVKQKNHAEIVADIEDILLSETDALTAKHFLIEREDDIDRTKVAKDYLDLAQDELIAQAVHALFPEIKTSGAEAMVNELINDLPLEDIQDRLGQVTKKLVELKVEEFKTSLPEIYKITTLQSMDELWTEHLNAMGDLREGISLRSYAQKDPLVEYKNEGFMLFEKFIASINSQIGRRILKIQRVARQQQERLVTNEAQVSDILTGSREMTAGLDDLVNKGRQLEQRRQNLGKGPQQTVKKQGRAFGRNDKVSVRYSDGTVKKDVKFKKVELDVESGRATVIS
ncbi:MAG: Protein translocase subunit SecA [candidate division WS6 bacterium OLB20]|uniref:Protein translocase subunit SecA n=1 Tax=candidate division WS6 bacterium OLB20 TaxID=1617426 RepID=A0A136LX66_9BACT|nr:MAG: Protein translocase subunit SecA [candidate division WS6 bacterium OLB20]